MLSWPPAASLYLHFLQSRQQRLVRLAHLLLVSPRISQGLLHLLLLSLRRADRLGAVAEAEEVSWRRFQCVSPPAALLSAPKASLWF